MKELNENELEIKFLKVYNSFKKNNINKIQRYLVNNHGLKAINGRTPLSKAKTTNALSIISGVLPS